MSQFLNFAWRALYSENDLLLNIILIPAGLIEAYLIISLAIVIFNITLPKTKMAICALLLAFTSMLLSAFVPAPYYIVLNYVFIFLYIKLFTKLSFIKTFIGEIFSTFTFGIINILVQNPYITLLNIDFETYLNIPIYRILYLIIVYSIIQLIIFVLKKFRNKRISLDYIDNLDKKTLIILCLNIVTGFITLILQLVITTFYINVVPLIITFANFVIFVLFFCTSIYSFTRIIKLADTRKNLESVEEYNKSLTILYDEVKGFNHDFKNIISTIDGYVENVDISALKQYIGEVKEDCRITNNLAILNPRTINNPGIYSLLNNKYFKATNAGIKFELDFFLDLNTLQVNNYKFSRILGVLLDNAIEEAEKCDEKIIKVSFRRENKNHRAVILIQNTYTNKNVDIEEIFKKGVSGKQNHSGIGLWEVRKYVKNSKNLDLFTSKNNEFFNQELTIYDLNY